MKRLLINTFAWLVNHWTYVVLFIFGGLAIAAHIEEMRAQYTFSVFQMTNLGMQPVQSLGVDNVTHERDGSICFRDIQKNSWGCQKAESYTLEPAGEEQ